MGRKDKIQKTNAVRILDRQKAEYELIEYATDDGQLDGISVAEKTGQAEETVYKTLVATAGTGKYFVFVIPVAGELDLRKAAKAAGEKKIEMLHLRDLTDVTGYVRGGCSPVGMKKDFPTFIDESARTLGRMIVSAGKRGLQMKLTPDALVRASDAVFAPLTK
ncbi:Cys-tRNA(Pro) deacylase [Bhargavaea beijingensis]|uniref:Cys-tRNA(Pro)/Cys-tRNA(Cys) deacylase n=1 Tax=Bhargavaea beijingensis TaxID=426756 RepID=A0A1G7DNT3_9BACL|nr:Cys-tRNA(Pro) deacylase [Bhargavaea beijingensis]MCW1928963.1 Cys-tRNA(Pro) deacylase [Bhargavaea beijingensis]RSK30037.1 Cys-tRNA(Pro) deacylase [Bhargavaea beijingensis]SDE53147.1 Cys-tRNA(Pro)/Cys-tRNA(Cys) deacylase [Bhargavaea beijingensis]